MDCQDEAAPLLNRRDRSPRGQKNRSRLCSWGCDLHASYIIIAVTFLERTAMYGISANLVQFLEYRNFLEWSTTTATIAALLSTSLAKLGAFLTGFLADTRFGRYRLLLASLSLQLFGSVCLMASSFVEYCMPSSYRELNNLLVLLGIIVFGCGMAGSMGTEIPLGLDQYAMQRESYSQARSFFPLYYLAANVGGFIALTALSTVQYNYLFGVGFSIPVLIYSIGILVLVACRKRLHRVPPSKSSPLLDVWKVVREARRVKKATARQRRPSYTSSSSSSDTQLTAEWVLFAEYDRGGTHEHNEVAYAQNFLAVLSVIASTIFYQVTISQTLTTYTTQGNLMTSPLRRNPTPLWKNGDQCNLHPMWHSNSSTELFVPATVFTAFNPLAVVLGIPLIHALIYPAWQYFSQGVPPSQLKRIAVGMLVAVFSLASAALVEVSRRQPDAWDSVNFTVEANRTLAISSLSTFWQLPQYILSGLAEVFVIVSALDFAYTYGPPNMKGACVGMVYSTMGLASLLSVASLTVIEISKSDLYYSAFTTDVSDAATVQGRVHVFYVILLITVFLGLLVFALAAQKFGVVPARARTGQSRRAEPVVESPRSTPSGQDRVLPSPFVDA